MGKGRKRFDKLFNKKANVFMRCDFKYYFDIWFV